MQLKGLALGLMLHILGGGIVYLSINAAYEVIVCNPAAVSAVCAQIGTISQSDLHTLYFVVFNIGGFITDIGAYKVLSGIRHRGNRSN